MRSARAFTLIEVVMAMAIALIIVTVIYTTTQAMATTAKRQGKMSEKDAQTAKFLEILRRDVRGRIVKSSKPGEKADVEKSPEQSSDTALLEISSTADSLSAFPMQRDCKNIKYVVTPSAMGFAVQRQENGLVLPVLSSNQLPAIESWDGKQWAAKLGSTTQHARVVRITIDGQKYMIGLPD